MQEARQLIEVNRPDEAWRVLSSFDPAPGDISAYHHVAAQALERSGAVPAALQHYRLAYLFAPSKEAKERVMLERAEAYLAAGFDHEAALCYEVFLRSFPWSQQMTRAYLGLADSRFRTGDYSEARRLYGLAGTSSRALYGKANALHALGRYDEARDIYLPLILRDKGFLDRSEETRLAVGENFRRLGKAQDAKIYLNTVQSPGLKPRADLGLGLIALQEGAVDEAISRIAAAAESPDRLLRHSAGLSLADAYAKAGRHDDALAALERVLREVPSNSTYIETALRISRAHRAKGLYEKSADVLRRLLASVAPTPEALDELEALVIAARDKDRDALLTVWKSAGPWLLEPSRSELLLSVARALRGSGNTFLAMTAWLQKHGSRSAQREAGLLLAEFYADLGDAPKAGRYLDAAGEGRDDAYRRVAARIHSAQGNARAAVDAVLAMREPREEDLLLLLNAPQQYRANEIAAYCDKTLRSLKGTVRLYARYADFLFSAGRRAEAMRYYRSAAAADLAPGASATEQKDREWARYRVQESASPAAPSQPGRDAAGRLAEADRKGDELLRKAKKVL